MSTSCLPSEFSVLPEASDSATELQRESGSSEINPWKPQSSPPCLPGTWSPTLPQAAFLASLLAQSILSQTGSRKGRVWGWDFLKRMPKEGPLSLLPSAVWAFHQDIHIPVEPNRTTVYCHACGHQLSISQGPFHSWGVILVV